MEVFIELLAGHGGTKLIDVRTVPRSRHNPQFNEGALPSSLAAANIGCIHALLCMASTACEIVSPKRLLTRKLTPLARIRGEEISYPFAIPRADSRGVAGCLKRRKT